MPLTAIIDNKEKVISMQDHLDTCWFITSTNDVIIPTIHILETLPWIIDSKGNVVTPTPAEVIEHRKNYSKFIPVFECSLCYNQKNECDIVNQKCCKSSFCNVCLDKIVCKNKLSNILCPYCRNKDTFAKCSQEYLYKYSDFHEWHEKQLVNAKALIVAARREYTYWIVCLD